MLELPGISYLPTTRAATSVLYQPDEEFPVGGSKVLVGRGRGDDRCGRHHRAEALAAAETLAAEGIRARAIDAYWVKPMRSTDWRFNGRSRLWARRRSALLSDGVADLHERGVRFSVATAKEQFRETLANSGLADEVDGFYPEVDSGVDAFRQRTNASGAAPGRDR